MKICHNLPEILTVLAIIYSCINNIPHAKLKIVKNYCLNTSLWCQGWNWSNIKKVKPGKPCQTQEDFRFSEKNQEYFQLLYQEITKNRSTTSSFVRCEICFCQYQWRISRFSALHSWSLKHFSTSSRNISYLLWYSWYVTKTWYPFHSFWDFERQVNFDKSLLSQMCTQIVIVNWSFFSNFYFIPDAN